MSVIAINEWVNRYHPGTDPDALPRFERVRAVVVEQALEQAVRSLNVGEQELVCIREIEVPVSLNLSTTLRKQAQAWSRAIVEQIKRQIAQDDRRTLLRYRSRGHAWISCAHALAMGNLRDGWAWRQLSLIEIDEAASLEHAVMALFEGLVTEPEFLVTVFGSLTARGVFELLLLRTEDRHWGIIRNGLSNHYNTRFEAIFPAGNNREERLDFAELFSSDDRQSPYSIRLQDCGVFHIDRLEAESRLVIAVVLLALTDPGILSRAPNIVKQQLMKLNHHSEKTKLPDDSAFPGTEAMGEKAVPTVTVAECQGGRTIAKNGRQEANATVWKNAASESGVEHRERAGGAWRNETSHVVDGNYRTKPHQLVSEIGGLLYLLNLLEEPCGLVESLSRQECFRQRAMTWVWLHLAAALLPAPLTEPALMTFAGLVSGRPLDDELSEAPNRDEHVQLDRAAGALLTAAQQRLGLAGSELDLSLDPGGLFRRRAVIRPDPGWIEVEFGLNDVDTGIRRSGLDIDPGFLPWLGIVMRFKYA